MSHRKPAERRQGHGATGVPLALAAVPAAPPPAPQPHWRADVADEWAAFWRSPMGSAKVTAATDYPALRRLFDLRNRLLVAQDAFDAEPVVQGSMGQPTLSPWAAEVHRLSASVAKLETEFGLTPMARVRLGVSIEEGIGLAARNADLLATFQQWAAATPDPREPGPS